MKAEDEGLELVGWNTARGHEGIDEQPMTDSSLERRAEDIKNALFAAAHDDEAEDVESSLWYETAQVIEQLLSENRQVRAGKEPIEELAAVLDRNEVLQRENGELRSDHDLRVTKAEDHARESQRLYDEAEAEWEAMRRDLSSAQSTIAQQKEDLDRVSAEREAYREAFKKDWNAPHVVHLAETGWRLQHPLRCHDDLDACSMNAYVAATADDLLQEEGHGFFEVTENQDVGVSLRRCDPHRLALNLARRILAENDR